jgi:hypothetical protein
MKFETSTLRMRSNRPRVMAYDDGLGLRTPVACAKCRQLFVPTMGVSGETDCFTCTPRAASPKPAGSSPPLETPKRKGRGRRFYHEREEGLRNMQHGGVVLLFGAFVTWATYAFSDSFVGFFVVAGGLILFGALRLIHGLTQYFSWLE